MSNKLLHSLTSSIVLTAILASAMTSAVAGTAEENTDRVVDQASVDMQDDADLDLSMMVKRYQGTKQEAEMLLRLAELRLEIADGMFRVAYGPGESGLKKAYLAKLAAGNDALTRLINAYPKSEQFPRALYLRGKSRKELAGENKALAAAALKDLEAFIARNPNRAEAAPAAIMIAELSIAKQNLSRAVSVLLPLSKNPSHSLYPNALHKRAWAFHVDAKPMAATAELSKLAASFNAREVAKTLSAGDQALRETVMADVPAIAYAARQSNPKGFSLIAVNNLLRSYNTAEGYQTMAVYFSDRLRAADLGNDLRNWKAIVLKSDPSRKSLSMMVGILEYDLDRSAFADVVTDAAEIAEIAADDIANPEAEIARKLMVRGADKLTKRIADYTKNSQSTSAEKMLASLLTSFDRMTPATDIRRLALRWNLAETHFALEQYAPAAIAYRWIAANWNPATKPVGKLSPSTARMRAIECRYEALRESGVIPSTLEVRASIAPAKDAAKMASLREFISWVEESEKLEGATLGNFSFEANRALYNAGHQDEAMARAKARAISTPAAKSSIAAASLVIDTQIARKRWDLVESDARDFASAKGWTTKTFPGQMMVQAASAKFKRAELAVAAKDFKLALTQANEFQKSYAGSNLALDAAGIACNASMSLLAFDDAVNCLNGLARNFPKTKAASQALRTAARIEDDRLHFSAAIAGYTGYLNASAGMKSDESLTIRKRILQLARAEGDAAGLNATARNKKLCANLAAECELNGALAALIQNDVRAVSAAHSRMNTGSKALRSVWATLVLEHPGSIKPQAAEQALQVLAKTWNETDPSVQYFLIAKLTKSVPSILEDGRNAVKSNIVAANESAMSRRMRALQWFEARSVLASAIPVNAVRAAAQNTLFIAYSDLINDLRAIPAPVGPNPAATKAMTAEQSRLIAGFVQPFILKSRKIRDASLALELREKRGLNPDQVDALWDRPILTTAAHADLRSEWSKAVKAGNWSRVGFLSNEVTDMKTVPASWSKAARAFTLATAGAAAEAKTVFNDACRNTGSAAGLRDACREVAKSAKGRG